MDTDSRAVQKEGGQDLPGFYEGWRRRVHGWVSRRAPGELADAILLAPDLLALVIRLLRDKRTPLPLKSQLLVVMIYVLSPVDILPEAVLGAMGLADDVVIMAGVLLGLMESASALDPAVLREHWSGQGDIAETIQEVVDNKGELVNTKVWKRIRGLFGQPQPDPVVVEGQSYSSSSSPT